MARDLKVLTRKDGVRTENPLLKAGDKYYISETQRTPKLRSEADSLQAPDKKIDPKLKAAAKALR